MLYNPTRYVKEEIFWEWNILLPRRSEAQSPATSLLSALTRSLLTVQTDPRSCGGCSQNSGRELFLLSEYILDCRRYHGESVDMKWRDSVDITWHDCDLRKWLNDEFYNTAFNATEKEFIKTTHCADNGEGADTEDKVFT